MPRWLQIIALTLTFLPIGFVGFVGSIIGDCGPPTTVAECSASKSEALWRTMAVIGTAYLGLCAVILWPKKR